MTSIATPRFRLELPEVWVEQQQDKEGLWQYRSQTGNESVSISTVYFAIKQAQAELERELMRYLNARRESELEVVGTDQIDVGATNVARQGNGVVGVYKGSHSAADRRFLAFAIADEAGITCLYYEAFEMSETEFSARSQLVVGRIGVLAV